MARLFSLLHAWLPWPFSHGSKEAPRDHNVPTAPHARQPKLGHYLRGNVLTTGSNVRQYPATGASKKDAGDVANAVDYKRVRFQASAVAQKLTFLFILEHNRFPHAKTWRVFFAGAKSPLQYAVYAFISKPAMLKQQDRAQLEIMGAHLLIPDEGTMPSRRGQQHSVLQAIRASIGQGLLDSTPASHFCILPASSTPVFSFSRVYHAISHSWKSSIDACHRPATRAVREAGMDAGLVDRLRGGNSAMPWAVLTRAHAQIVYDKGAALEAAFETFCKRHANLRACVTDQYFLPTVLAEQIRPWIETDCAGSIVRRAPLFSGAADTNASEHMAPAMLVRLRRHSCDNLTSSGAPIPPPRSAAFCQMFVVQSWSPGSVLHTFCNSIDEPPEGVNLESPDAAMLATTPCRRAGARPWHKVPNDYTQRLERIRRYAKSTLMTTRLTGNMSGANSSATQALAASGAAQSGAHGSKRLLFAYSFWLTKWPSVVANLEGWHGQGRPCSGLSAPFMTLLMAPGFPSSTSPSELLSVQRSLGPAIDRHAASCFREVEWHVQANFSGRDADYPLAPSLAFFDIVFNTSFRRRFDVLWMMEQDLRPIRPLFLDALYQEALTPAEFWIKGSMHRGMPAYERSGNLTWLADSAWLKRSRSWLFHINGAALYGLNYPLFDEVLKAAMALTRRNPDLPWDVTICIALIEATGLQDSSVKLTDSFPLLQHASTHVHFTDFVWNVGSQVEKRAVLEAAFAAGVYLLHGQAVHPMRDDQLRVAREKFRLLTLRAKSAQQARIDAPVGLLKKKK